MQWNHLAKLAYPELEGQTPDDLKEKIAARRKRNSRKTQREAVEPSASTPQQ